jgi:hypothetical protein
MDFQTRSGQAAAGKWNPWAEGVRQMLRSLCFSIGDIRAAWNGGVLDLPWGARPIFWLKKEIWFDILKWREES